MSATPVLSGAVGAHRRREPAAALREHFASTWAHVLPSESVGPIAVVPDGCIDLQWVDGVMRVAGPDRVAKREPIRPGATVIGFRFRPAAARLWLRTAACEIVDARVPLDAFWGAEARRLAEWAGAAGTAEGIAARIEEALARRAMHLERPDRIGAAIVRVLESDFLIERDVVRHLCAELGVSERTLRRRCHEAFGYGPKTLQRILRFQRFLRLARGARGARLAGLAAEVGYADQAHLAREARRVAGLTPATILAQLGA